MYASHYNAGNPAAMAQQQQAMVGQMQAGAGMPTNYQQNAQNMYNAASAMAQMPALTPSMSGGTANAAMQGMAAMQQGMQQNAQNQASMDQSMAGLAATFGAGAAGGMGAAGMMPALNQMAAMAGLTPAAMQAMYQQYAMRWAAMQRFAAASQGMGGMGAMGAMGAMAGFPGAGMGMGMSAGGAAGGDGKSVYWKTRICNKWKEGLCQNSDSCRYAHGDGDLRPPGAAGQAAAPAPAQQVNGAAAPRTIETMKKTRLCQEFMQTGACKYGVKCTFAHGQHELRSNPGQGTGQRTNIHKTKLCQRFMQTGQCQYGMRCTFAHGEAELRPMAPASAQTGAAAGSGYAVAASGGQQGKQECGECGHQHHDHQAKQDPGSEQQHHQESAPQGGQGQEEGLDGSHFPSAMGPEGEEAQGAGSGDAGAGSGGMKRTRSDATEDQQSKRQHQEAEEDIPEPDCQFCAQLVHAGRKKVVDSIMGLENPQAKKLGCMIMAASNRIDQLWLKCTPAMLLDWLSKLQVNVMDKIDVLKAVIFHVHEDVVRPHPELVGKYQEMGLPRDIADFVCMVMEGKEGSASMSEYFHMLEVAKILFGVNDDNYYTVSTAVASIMMGM